MNKNLDKLLLAGFFGLLIFNLIFVPHLKLLNFVFLINLIYLIFLIYLILFNKLVKPVISILIWAVFAILALIFWNYRAILFWIFDIPVLFPIFVTFISFLFFTKYLYDLWKTRPKTKFFSKNVVIVLISIGSFILGSFIFYNYGSRMICVDPAWFSCDKYEFDWSGETTKGKTFLNDYTKNYAKKQRERDDYSAGYDDREKLKLQLLPDSKLTDIVNINNQTVYINEIKIIPAKSTSELEQSNAEVAVIDYTYHNQTDYISRFTNDATIKDSGNFVYNPITDSTRRKEYGLLNGMSQLLPGQKTRNQAAFRIDKGASLKEATFEIMHGARIIFDLGNIREYKIANPPDTFADFTELKQDKVFTEKQIKSMELFSFQVTDQTRNAKNELELTIEMINISEHKLTIHPRGRLFVVDNLGFLYETTNELKSSKLTLEPGQTFIDKITILKSDAALSAHGSSDIRRFEINYQAISDSEQFIYRTNSI